MEAPRHWRLRKQRLALIGEDCPHCSEKIFPPRDICPSCDENTMTSPLKKAYASIGRYAGNDQEPTHVLMDDSLWSIAVSQLNR
jgi:hypothetical protein